MGQDPGTLNPKILGGLCGLFIPLKSLRWNDTANPTWSTKVNDLWYDPKQSQGNEELFLKIGNSYPPEN